jgi:hypothetical protein
MTDGLEACSHFDAVSTHLKALQAPPRPHAGCRGRALFLVELEASNAVVDNCFLNNSLHGRLAARNDVTIINVRQGLSSLI